MRKTLAAFAAILALGAVTAGCSDYSVLTAAISDKAALSSTTLDEKTLFAVKAAELGANQAADAAVKAGLLKPGSPDAVRIADLLVVGHKASDAATAAYKLGDAATFGAKIAAANGAIGAAFALVPVHS